MIRMSKDPYLSQEELKRLLRHEPETGHFYWLVRLSPRTNAGRIAGTQHWEGYIFIGIHGHTYQAHRLVWLYVYGKWPDRQIDHKNGVKNDNRLENLREATSQQNARNRRKVRAKSGFKGVTLHKGHLWRATIYVDGRPKNLGHYTTPELAAAAYKAAAIALDPEFARLE